MLIDCYLKVGMFLNKHLKLPNTAPGRIFEMAACMLLFGSWRLFGE